MTITLNPVVTSTQTQTPNEIITPADSQGVKLSIHLPKTQKNSKNGGKRNLQLKKVDLVEACKMRFTDRKTLAEIGNYFEVSPQAIDQALQKFIKIFGDPVEIKIFNDNRAAAWTNMERIGVDTVVDKKGDLSVSEGIKLSKEAHGVGRLEADKSTSNIAFLNMTPEDLAALGKFTGDSNRKALKDAYDAEVAGSAIADDLDAE